MLCNSPLISLTVEKADLDLYADYLLSTFGAARATGLSAMVDGEVSHDQITRFLSGQEYTAKYLLGPGGEKGENIEYGCEKNAAKWHAEPIVFCEEQIANEYQQAEEQKEDGLE